MLKSWSQKGKDKLSNALSFLGNKIFPKRSSMASSETELTAPEADPANSTLSVSDSEKAAVSISGTASSSGQHPETIAFSSSNHLSGELRIDDDGVWAYLSFRAPIQAPYILFGLGFLSLVDGILELKLPGLTPTLLEGVLAAAAGIGFLTSSSAISLQVKDPSSSLAKVLSQISTIFLGSSLLVKLSTRFLFEQYMPVNIVTTAVLFLFMVGVVFWAGKSTAVN